MGYNDYVTNEGTELHALDATTNITPNANCTVSTDNTIYKRDNSVKITNTNAGTLSIIDITGISWTIESSDIFSFWLYIPDKSKITASGFNIYLTNDGFANYYTLGISRYVVKDGWNLIKKQSSDWNTSGAPSWGAFNQFRMNFTSEAGETPSVYIDDMRKNFLTKAYVVTIYDDGYRSPKQLVADYYTSNNQNYSIGIVSDNVDTTNYLTTNDILEQSDDGFDFINHTSDHSDLTTLTDDEIAATVNECEEFLEDLGITSKPLFIYPQGSFNSSVISKLQSLGYYYSRSATIEAIQNLVLDNYMDINSVPLENTTTTGDIEDAIDEAIAKGGVVFFYGHKVVSSGASDSLEVNLAVAKHIVDYVVANSSDVEAMTFSDFINNIINDNIEVFTNMGTKRSGKPEKERYTGSAALSETFQPTNTARPFLIHGLYIHLNTASATSENLTVDLDANAGSTYDDNLETKDMDTIKDYHVEIDRYCEPGDSIDLAWANTNTRTYGVTLEWSYID